MHGMRDSKVRERLLRETNLTLERAYEMVQAAEATAEQTHFMSGEQAVCAVKANSGRGQGYKGRGGPGNYVTMRTNKRNQPLSANFAHMSMHQNSVRPTARNVVSVVR